MKDNWQLSAVFAIIAAAIFVPIIKAFVRRRKGKPSSSCSCGCHDCPIANKCTSKK